ncbi:NAD(P)-dependent oxidoreductase [Paramicrobacterium agarici]|uniref:NAD(P)-binding domain-containing protein n=1 Tax=Paramicrobacterium agarici TaxID=630514 RepID=A0A2A9DRX6_9MICO|nr:NAD(P)H-binding protein [Microbacterium agarici]PFG29547.1 hypothetical protein ATJ78_0454 [Microbacterium agarici]
MAHVVVFGATGYAGGHITNELLERGHSVTAVARDTSKLEARDRLTAEQGSIHDPAFVTRVSSGADAVIVALRAADDNGEKLVEAMPHVLAVAAEVGARVGIVGGAGSLRVSEGGPLLIDTPAFPDAAKDEASAHKKVLDLVRDTPDVDWFYVSPGAEFGSWAPGERTGKYRVSDEILLTDAEGHSFISGADLAIAFADEIENPAHHGARFGVAY